MSDKCLAVMKEYFGYSGFRKGQREVIEKILAGNDVLGVMPTGSGKSVCYQVPAILFPGTTIVVSPLISLMKDQVDTLSQNAVPAAFINSSLSSSEFFSVIAKARRGEYKLIYLAPERMELDSFNEFVSELDISFLAVDEAHCISQWGHNFRPSYLKVSEMIGMLPKRPPVAAFTATATPQVVDDIKELLELRSPFVHITGFDRENLCFDVVNPENKFNRLCAELGENRNGSSIVYCSTRKTVDNITDKLNEKGFSATRYHAGLDDDERIENQEKFLYDRAGVIVATNAFGMGIDKSNIRLVIHYNMPKTMEHYYQEAGRAGRDGEPARCILFYSAADIVTNRFLIDNDGVNKDSYNNLSKDSYNGVNNDSYNGRNNESHTRRNSDSYIDRSSIRNRDYKKLQQIIDYCNIVGCLRQYILKYFGENDTAANCQNCGNCINEVAKSDVTVEAQKILSCIFRVRERFGSMMVIDVLKGSKNEKVLGMGFDKLSTYGIMEDYPKPVIREIISFLIAENFITVMGGEYPVLSLSPKAYKWLKNGTGSSLYMKKITAKKEKKSAARASSRGVLELNGDEAKLFEELRRVRMQIARAQRVPPFVVFSDASLKDMCKRMPRNDFEMLEVTGVGNHKLNKYGKKFIAVIDSFLDNKET